MHKKVGKRSCIEIQHHEMNMMLPNRFPVLVYFDLKVFVRCLGLKIRKILYIGPILEL
jgi:hypothetical protein